jgi:small subunit ribosomal protein S20
MAFFNPFKLVQGVVMANTAQARKRARQSIKRNAHNAAQRSALRTAIKKVRKAIAAGDKAKAEAQLRQSQGVIDSVAAKGVFHRNAAARHKSRLSAAIKAMS